MEYLHCALHSTASSSLSLAGWHCQPGPRAVLPTQPGTRHAGLGPWHGWNFALASCYKWLGKTRVDMEKPGNGAVYHVMGEEHVWERGSACDQLVAWAADGSAVTAREHEYHGYSNLWFPKALPEAAWQYCRVSWYFIGQTGLEVSLFYWKGCIFLRPCSGRALSRHCRAAPHTALVTDSRTQDAIQSSQWIEQSLEPWQEQHHRGQAMASQEGPELHLAQGFVEDL